MGQNVDERVQMLTKQLDLTPEQQPKVRSILEEQQKQLTALRQNSSMSEEDRRAKMQEIHRSGMEQIRGILTPEQQQKMQQMRQNMEHHQGNHEGAPPQNPPSDH
jgi:Spy/CpxP family protein refolding chaperone